MNLPQTDCRIASRLESVQASGRPCALPLYWQKLEPGDTGAVPRESHPGRAEPALMPKIKSSVGLKQRIIIANQMGW